MLDPWALSLTFRARGRRTLPYKTSAPRVAGSMTNLVSCDLDLLWGKLRLTPDGEDGLEDKV